MSSHKSCAERDIIQVGVGARRVPQAGHHSPGVKDCTPVGPAIQLC
jgi:hypothetical protein